jgi:hypothetical protein
MGTEVARNLPVTQNVAHVILSLLLVCNGLFRREADKRHEKDKGRKKMGEEWH